MRYHVTIIKCGLLSQVDVACGRWQMSNGRVRPNLTLSLFLIASPQNSPTYLKNRKNTKINTLGHLCESLPQT